MKKILFILLSGLLLAAPAGPLRACPAPAYAQADETLSDATAQQVLNAAASQVGESSASLYAQYKAGTVSITDQGPIRGGHRYTVSRGSDFIIIIDIID